MSLAWYSRLLAARVVDGCFVGVNSSDHASIDVQALVRQCCSFLWTSNQVKIIIAYLLPRRIANWNLPSCYHFYLQFFAFYVRISWIHEACSWQLIVVSVLS